MPTFVRSEAAQRWASAAALRGGARETWKENLLAGTRPNPVSGASRCPLHAGVGRVMAYGFFIFVQLLNSALDVLFRLILKQQSISTLLGLTRLTLLPSS